MSNTPKFYSPRKLMPGAPLPSLQTRATEGREFQLAMAQQFTPHLRHYLSDTPSPQSGSRGIHLNRLSHLDTTSHAYIYEVEGVPLWGHGMDFDTAGTGRADYIPVFDNSANAGGGADVFRWSGEADAVGSKTCKFNAGRLVGTPRANDCFGFFNGGDNTTGLGGLSVGFFDNSATYSALKLFNRSSTKKRTLVNFNGQYLLGSDRANLNAQAFSLYDSVLAKDVLSIDSTGLVTTPLNLLVQGTNVNSLTIQNTGIGGLYLQQMTAGLNRTVINMNNLFQWGTDLAFNGSDDFWFQNLGTGNAFMYCDASDKVTLGSTNASGGAILGASGGKASFYGGSPVSKQTLTGDWLGNTAVKNLAAALGSLGAVTDSTNANDPTVPSWSWFNQGGASVTTSNGTVFLNAPAGAGDSLRGRFIAAPTAPYTITMGFIPMGHNQNFLLLGLALYDSVGGGLVTLAWTNNSGLLANAPCISASKWTNGTTFSANYTTTPATIPAVNWQAGKVMWMRIQDDSTNRIMSISNDGVNFSQILSTLRTDFITPNNVGFFVDANNASFGAGINVVYWKKS